MSLSDRCLIRSRGPSGEPVVRLGVPLVDDYLEFLAGRCRPKTVLAAAYDLRVFFTGVDKPPADVRPADVLGFITAQRTGRSKGLLQSVADIGESTGVATSTVARRLSTVCAASTPLLERPRVNQLSRLSADEPVPAKLIQSCRGVREHGTKLMRRPSKDTPSVVDGAALPVGCGGRPAFDEQGGL